MTLVPDDDPKRLILVQNERVKLLAGALDRASTALFTVGVVTPAAAYLYNIQGIRDLMTPGAATFGFLAFAAGSTALHLLARRVLRELTP